MLNFLLKAKTAHLRLGRRGEKLAADFYNAIGCCVLCRNYRCAAGELDLIVLDGVNLRFIEVKTLRFKPGFTPSGNLSLRQMHRNYKAACFYSKLIENQMEVHFDLIEIEIQGLFIKSLRRTADYLPAIASHWSNHNTDS